MRRRRRRQLLGGVLCLLIVFGAASVVASVGRVIGSLFDDSRPSIRECIESGSIA